MLSALAWILVVGLVVAGLLYAAVWANGPAVLDAVDRLTGPGRDTELVETATYGNDPAQKLRVYRPGAAQGPLPVFIFSHGGAWAHGDPDDYGFVARNIAPEGYLVVLIGYRMNESGRYPAMLADTAQAIRWVRDNAARLGGDPDRLLLGGHSAGAYNVVETVLDPQFLAAAGVPLSAIRGIVGLSGPYDFYPYTTDRSQAAFGSVGAGPESQPVNHAHRDAPPMLLGHGEADTTVRIRNSIALARALQAKGATVETLWLPGAEHNAPLLNLTHPFRRRSPGEFAAVTRFLAAHAQLSVPVQSRVP